MELSDDEDCDADESSEAFQSCLKGSRIVPMFAALLGEHTSEGAPVHEPQSETAGPPCVIRDQEDHAQWHNVGLRLAAVMKEDADQGDAEEEHLGFCGPCESSRAGIDVDEKSWQIVGIRLAHLFSSLDNDSETCLPVLGAGESATVAEVDISRGGSRQHRKECLLEAHERWRTVGSRLAAVLKTFEQ